MQGSLVVREGSFEPLVLINFFPDTFGIEDGLFVNKSFGEAVINLSDHFFSSVCKKIYILRAGLRNLMILGASSVWEIIDFLRLDILISLDNSFSFYLLRLYSA